MTVQPVGNSHPNYMFFLNNECCAKANEIREKAEGILREIAKEHADANMSDGEALVGAVEILSWGGEGFANELKAFYQNTPDVAALVKVLISSNQRQLTSNLYDSGELKKILQNRI